jgi:phosphomevalonate kinase
MSRLVLCISGKRFAGKDTFARQLIGAAKDRGITLQTYAFAGESKRMFAAARPEVDLARLLDDRDYKEQWRPQLTQFTVDALAADPLVFVREVMRRIHVADGFPLITDLRLRLELDHLRKVSQPYVMRVTRSDANRMASGWTYDTAKDTHHTETELDDPALWNEQIVNDGSELALGRLADDVVKRLLI